MDVWRSYVKLLVKMGDSEEMYSEEFESDYEPDYEDETPPIDSEEEGAMTPPDLLLDENKLFSRLMAGLENALSSSEQLNYAEQPQDKSTALGVFLARLPSSKEDFTRRIHLEYARKKEDVRTRLAQKLGSYRLQPQQIINRCNERLKSLGNAAAMESDLFNYKEEQLLQQTTEELKKYVLLSILDLEKQVRVSAHFIRQGQLSNLKRAEELQDEFLWRRFIQRVQNLARNKVMVSEPNSSVKSDLKKVLEDKMESKVLLKNALMLEDHEFAEVSSGRQSSSERKSAISKVCNIYKDTETRHIDKILTKLLTLQHSQKPSELATPKTHEKGQKRGQMQSFPLSTCLSRSCKSYAVIASLQPINWSPLTLLLYYSQRDLMRLFEERRSILVAEEPVVVNMPGIIEVEELLFSGMKVTCEVAGTAIELQVATVKTLAQLSGTVGLQQLSEIVEQQYGAQPPTNLMGLYVLETLSIFQAAGRASESRFIRRVSQTELEELCRFYLLKMHIQHIPRDLFPDSHSEEDSLKYCYVLIRDLITLRSGNFCRNWLIQFKPMGPRPVSVGPPPAPRFCRWVGCLSPSLEEADMASLQESLDQQLRGSFSNSDMKRTRKKRKSHSTDPSFVKKALAPIRKSRNSALDTSSSASLCDFHSRLRHFMKANSMLLSPYLEDSSTELWKAVQAGMRWQAELSSKMKLGPVCNGNAKQALKAYYLHATQVLSIRGRERLFSTSKANESQPDDGFEEHREQLTDSLSDLRAKRDTEVMFTSELRELLISSASASNIQAMCSLLSEAANGPVTAKLAKLRAIKERIRDAGNSTMSDVNEFKGYVQVSRPHSQNQYIHSERNKDPSPDHQRSRLDDVLHRKVYTSPYGERMYKPGRVVKPKLPPKVPQKPLDSQQSSRKKIPLLNMD